MSYTGQGRALQEQIFFECSAKVDTIKKMKRIMTVDLEYDFETHEVKNLEYIPKLLRLFDEFKITATFFVVGELVEKYPDLIKHIAKKHEIASHSYNHIYLDKLNEKQLEEQVVKSKQAIENLGIKCYGFRAPYFVTHPKLWKLLIKHGYTYDSSMSCTWFPGRYNHIFSKNKPYQKQGIIELPVPNLFGFILPSGLSYYRLLFPLSKMFQIPYQFYLHPCEFLEDIPSNKINKIVSSLYSRNKGKKAWNIFYYFLKKNKSRWVSCKMFIS